MLFPTRTKPSSTLQPATCARARWEWRGEPGIGGGGSGDAGGNVGRVGSVGTFPTAPILKSCLMSR
eukprot:278544-Prymnesium_polylepis.1